MDVCDNFIPTKCGLCTSRNGTLTVSCFAMIFSLMFLIATSIISEGMRVPYNRSEISGRPDMCNMYENTRMVANSMALLATLNAVEFIMSMSLIWGVKTKKTIYFTGWLVLTFIWFVMHSAMASLYIITSLDLPSIAAVTIIGVIFLVMGILSMLIVLSFRKELIDSQHPPFTGRSAGPTDVPPSDPIYESVPSAPIYESVSLPSQQMQLYSNVPVTSGNTIV